MGVSGPRGVLVGGGFAAGLWCERAAWRDTRCSRYKTCGLSREDGDQPAIYVRGEKKERERVEKQVGSKQMVSLESARAVRSCVVVYYLSPRKTGRRLSRGQIQMSSNRDGAWQAVHRQALNWQALNRQAVKWGRTFAAKELGRTSRVFTRSSDLHIVSIVYSSLHGGRCSSDGTMHS